MDPDLRVSVQLSEPSRYCASAGITSQAGEQVLRRPGSRSRSRDLSLRLARPLLPSGYAVHSSRDRHTAIAKQVVQFRDPIVISAWHRHDITGGPVSRPLGAAQLAHVLVRRHARPLQGALLELINFNVLYWTGLDCTIMQCNALSKVRCSSSSTSM